MQKNNTNSTDSENKGERLSEFFVRSRTFDSASRPPCPPRNVSIIPATKRSICGGALLKQQTNIRVAAYCRVSTGDESQQTSYTNQEAFYSGLILSKPDWKFAGIYADEGISGTSTLHRDGFNRMIADARAGKIDYILTKSISRFARNTVTTLSCARELRRMNPPVGIYFEKENIDTLDATGELLLTIMSAMAQDESRSISDNIRWSFQKRFQVGIPQINLTRMIGYDKGENGEWIVNGEQARLVRHIFSRYVGGASANKIASELNEAGIFTIAGKRWRAGGIINILKNEKYVGDIEMQKTITKDFLTHRSVKNKGEAPKYYVENHHAPIIDRALWEKAQAAMSRGTSPKTARRGSVGSVLGNLVCGEGGAGRECGGGLSRTTYSSVARGYRDDRRIEVTGVEEGTSPDDYSETYTFSHPVWKCRSCAAAALNECAVKQSFMEMLYYIKRDCEKSGDNSKIKRKFRTECSHSRIAAAYEERLDSFIGRILELPETNAAGERLAVNGLDNAATHDFLDFDKGIYSEFVEKGIVHGDSIEYRTSFGISLVSVGNRRTLADFVGFKRCTAGALSDSVCTVELLDAAYKVDGGKVRYSRKPKKK